MGFIDKIMDLVSKPKDINGIPEECEVVFFGTRRSLESLRKQKKTSQMGGSFIGAPGGTRTHNLLIRSQMLYPIKLRAH